MFILLYLFNKTVSRKKGHPFANALWKNSPGEILFRDKSSHTAVAFMIIAVFGNFVGNSSQGHPESAAHFLLEIYRRVVPGVEAHLSVQIIFPAADIIVQKKSRGLCQFGSGEHGKATHVEHKTELVVGEFVSGRYDGNVTMLSTQLCGHDENIAFLLFAQFLVHLPGSLVDSEFEIMEGTATGLLGFLQHDIDPLCRDGRRTRDFFPFREDEVTFGQPQRSVEDMVVDEFEFGEICKNHFQPLLSQFNLLFVIFVDYGQVFAVIAELRAEPVFE